MATEKAEVRAKYPNSEGGVQCVFIENTGNTAVHYFEGNYDLSAMAQCIRQYVYVNAWRVVIQQCSLSE